MRFYNNNDGKIYKQVEDYINRFYLELRTAIEPTAVTIRFPNGIEETHLFFDPDGLDDCWITCADDYVESEPYIDIIGFAPVENIRINGTRLTADFTHFYPKDKIAFYEEYIGLSNDLPSLGDAINSCNEALKDKPRIDFSGVKMIK